MKVKLFINNNDKSRDFANSLQKKLIKKGFIIAEEDYDLAIEAHRRGLLVKVEGKTSVESENTYNAISISILEACNPTVRLRKRVNAQRYGIRVLYGIC